MMYFKLPRPMKDYPAAHSMDSGWFAIDNFGKLALFQTGEVGAMPKRASTILHVDQDMEIFFYQQIIPWIARHISLQKFPDLAEVFVLFDSPENAEELLSLYSFGPNQPKPCKHNPLLVELNRKYERIEDNEWEVYFEGFVGLSPIISDLLCTPYDDFLPATFYSCGYQPPGLYTKDERPHGDLSIHDTYPGILNMNTNFAHKNDIQLADFYKRSDCIKYEDDIDFRTGKPIK